MTAPQRPAFFEGQILAAADLTATVDHARAHAARHDRYLHDWGIAEGLGLATEDRTDGDVNYVAVNVRPGMAIDGTGREIVVRTPAALSEAQFAERNGIDDTDASNELYPVFLAGLDRDPVATSMVTDAQPSRVDESYQIIFGRPGDERLVGEQSAPTVGDAPGDGSTPWLVLLGYVAWRGGHFAAVATTARGVAVRYAGIRADTVTARNGGLTLRARPDAVQGSSVMTVDDQDGLVFGRYKGDGTVDELLVVSPAGDLTVRGGISGDQDAGGVAAVSGVATDGVLLPLPAGVDAAQVDDGRVTLHVQLTPRTSAATPEPDGIWLPGAVEAAVDSDRRVRCRMRWARLDAAPVTWHDLPGTVDFLVLATVAADPGASGGSS